MRLDRFISTPRVYSGQQRNVESKEWDARGSLESELTLNEWEW